MLTQDVTGTAGNGKTLTAGTAFTSLIIHTLGGLPQPANVEVGRTIQLVAVDQTGAVIVPTSWLITSGTSATVTDTGLVMATATTGAAVITATLGTNSASFVVVAIPTQTITSLAVTLVPATPEAVSYTHLRAHETAAGYPVLDYTAQAA